MSEADNNPPEIKTDLYQKMSKLRETFEIGSIALKEKQIAVELPFKSISLGCDPSTNLKNCIIHGIAIQRMDDTHKCSREIRWFKYLLENWHNFAEIDGIDNRWDDFTDPTTKRFIPNCMTEGAVETLLKHSEKRYKELTTGNYIQKKMTLVRQFWCPGLKTFCDMAELGSTISEFITIGSGVPWLNQDNDMLDGRPEYIGFDVWLWRHCDTIWEPFDDNDAWEQLQNIYNEVMRVGPDRIEELSLDFKDKYSDQAKVLVKTAADFQERPCLSDSDSNSENVKVLVKTAADFQRMEPTGGSIPPETFIDAGSDQTKVLVETPDARQ